MYTHVSTPATHRTRGNKLIELEVSLVINIADRLPRLMRSYFRQGQVHRPIPSDFWPSYSAIKLLLQKLQSSATLMRDSASFAMEMISERSARIAINTAPISIFTPNFFFPFARNISHELDIVMKYYVIYIMRHKLIIKIETHVRETPRYVSWLREGQAAESEINCYTIRSHSARVSFFRKCTQPRRNPLA